MYQCLHLFLVLLKVYSIQLHVKSFMHIFSHELNVANVWFESRSITPFQRKKVLLRQTHLMKYD
jgi:hypothetical protein